MALYSDRNWCWGSLRPWQILHSRLAEKGTRGQALDVCGLIDETLGAADLRNGDEDAARYYHEAYFLDDDGEFWRHGGVMEARIREWLARREAEAEEEEEEEQVVEEQQQEKDLIVLSKCCASRSAIATRAWSARPHEEEDAQVEEQPDDDGGYEEEEEAYPIIAGGGAAKHFATRPNTATSGHFSYDDAHAPDLCPVCLEKLLPNEPLYLLPCRHKFHSMCLSPWLVQRPHACCPCCRAPVPANFSPRLPNMAAATPPDLAPSGYSDSTQSDGDIMCLLEDMEAALERFGLRS